MMALCWMVCKTMNNITAGKPSRGQVWMTTFDPVVGHEQASIRPAIVVSVDKFNHGPSNRVIVVPTTSRDRGLPLHVRLDPPDGGCTVTSFARPEDIRAVSPLRLLRYMGEVGEDTMEQLLVRLKVLLGL